MATHSQSDLQFEIGHVLFIDIVGYSKLLIDQQRERIRELKEIVRGTEQFRLAEAEGKLLRLPTGDGGALVFRNTQEAPVLCALEISKALKKHPELRVRMGIHSGPVKEVADLTEQMNVAGAGINTARRVMDCGDAGHILLSKHVAEDLEEYEEWRPRLHDLGTCEVKHGVPIGITNVYDSEVGNPQLPKKLQALKRHRTRVRWAEAAVALLVLAAIATAFVFLLRRPTRSALAITGKSIAVLPFENLSEEKANAYFAEGIKNEILTRLATVRDLKVISRTSTTKYQSKPDNLKTVAQELGVSTILEGAVQKAGDKVRINVQLIDARADRHLWGKSYDRDFKDVLGVESEVSQEIADALQANLSPSESHALASAGTRDAEAYDLFLRGEYELHQAEGSPAADVFDRADAFYRQALERDPNFVEAAAELARSRLWRHWWVSPLAPAELEEVKSLIDRALALGPNSPEAHLALGLFFYFGHRQYENALTEFNRTLELQPNNALARANCAYVYRRRGDWERSLADSQRAQEVDPRDALNPTNIGVTYVLLRQWKDAERVELRALAIDPHNALAALWLLLSRLNSTGDVGSARRAVDGFPEAIRSLTLISFRGATASGDVSLVTGWPLYLDVIERRFADAFQALEKEVVNDDRARLQQLARRAALRVLAGQTEAAKSVGEEAVPLLEARLRERPDDTFAMTELSWVYLALGRNADALRLSRQAADLMSIEKDAVTGPGFQSGLAQIEARAGAPEEAIKRLRRLLSIPAGWVVSIARLKIDPVWDPIRNRRDFQQLLSGPEQIGPNNKPTTSTQTLAERPTFASDIRPILQSSCQPCHFQGGQMYEKLPFDKPETITKLGTKLFTRIKDEDQQRVIREFLSEQSANADR
jgi:TolB-like protein/Flp pilus assembly protein TadD